MKLQMSLGILIGVAIATLALADDARIPTKPVTLRIQHESAQEAFEKLGRAAHVHFEPRNRRSWGELKDAVSYECTNTPFPQALCELCAASGLFPVSSAEGRIELAEDQDGAWIKRPRTFAQTLLITAQQIEMERTIVLNQNPTPKVSTDIGLLALSDPNFPAIGFDHLHVDSLTDGSGKPIALAPMSDHGSFNRGLGGIDIAVDARGKLKTIGLLKVTLTPIVISQTKTITIDLAGKTHDTFSAGPAKVDMDIRSMGGGCNLQMKVTSEDTDYLKHFQNSTFAMYPKVSDAKGAEYVYRGGGGGLAGPKAYIVSYQFRVNERSPVKPAAFAKLVWTIPTGFQGKPLTFELKDLEIK